MEIVLIAAVVIGILDYLLLMPGRISPGAVKCPRQQVEKRFRKHIMDRFNRTE